MSRVAHVDIGGLLSGRNRPDGASGVTRRRGSARARDPAGRTDERTGVARIFYDTEFIEDGTTIELVSVGAVDEQGREFYAISTEFDPEHAGPWVRRHVLDKLPSPSDPAWCTRVALREAFYGFVTASEGDVELWAWYAAYDHVAIAQLWGAMPELPRALPRFTRDLRQRWEDVGRPELPPPPADAHDALADARHNLRRWEVIDRRWRQLGAS